MKLHQLYTSTSKMGICILLLFSREPRPYPARKSLLCRRSRKSDSPGYCARPVSGQQSLSWGLPADTGSHGTLRFVREQGSCDCSLPEQEVRM